MNEIVRRIVDVAHPLRIILFGSAARGEMGLDSDLDLLVVVPDGVHRRQTARLAFRSLRGMGLSKDIIVVTKQDLVDYGQGPSLIIASALSEGKELYNAT
ncbi:MAG: nucleotidyltransferase domain-containing protein [Magnetococcales bacterium]|nr:nucleotidyltransferase domain-containing protein [Magnetococcales bacterium]